MKKFVLVITCILILTIFVAFNYLLWDRENKIESFQNLTNSKNLNIDTLSEKLKNLEDANNQLSKRISELEEANKSLSKDLSEKTAQLQEVRSKAENDIAYKNDILYKLKQQADMRVFEALVKKWADSIDKGQYEDAYNMQAKDNLGKIGIANLTDFVNSYKNSVKSLKIKSVKMNTDSFPYERMGEVILNVTLEIKKVDYTTNRYFDEGLNERFFILTLNDKKDDWLIQDIATFK